MSYNRGFCSFALIRAIKREYPQYFAERQKCSLAQLAIAWAYHRGNDIIPLIGAGKVERLNEALGAERLGEWLSGRMGDTAYSEGIGGAKR